MPENNNIISPETKITFTLKGFVGTIISILSIFVSFYFMVVNPRIDKAEQHGKEILEEYKQSNDAQFKILKELIEKDHSEFSQSIKAALETSKANTERFNDIERASNVTENHGGGSSTRN